MVHDHFAAFDTRMLQLGSNGAAAGATPTIVQEYLYEDIGLGGQ
jgi:hypothetical protein